MSGAVRKTTPTPTQRCLFGTLESVRTRIGTSISEHIAMKHFGRNERRFRKGFSGSVDGEMSARYVFSFLRELFPQTVYCEGF